MINTYSYNKSKWIDIGSPTKNEVDKVMIENRIDPIVAKDFLDPTPSQKTAIFSGGLYFVMHFPAFKHSHRSGNMIQEVDFVILKNTLITVRYDTIDIFERFAKEYEVESITKSDQGGIDYKGYDLFLKLFKELNISLSNELLSIGDRISVAEENIFSGKEKEMVLSLSELGIELLLFKKTVFPHFEALIGLAKISKEIFGAEFFDGVMELSKDSESLMNRAVNLLDLLRELRDTNDSILSTKQNEIMKTLTIMAFITFPLALIASIFGMNTSFIPLVGLNNDFWIVMGIMAISVFLFFGYFKYKKWF